MPNTEIRYNDETVEILDKVPSWLTRWGLSVIFMIFLGFVTASYLMKFPQILTAPIILTTSAPPVDLVVKTSGRIDTILVKNGSTVTKNQIIAVLENSSNSNDVLVVRDSLLKFNINNNNQWIEKSYSMGDLQSSFSDFRMLYNDYISYLEISNINRRISILLSQLDKYKDYVYHQERQYQIMLEDYSLSQQRFNRDSTLFIKGVSSLYEYEDSRKELMQKKSNLEENRAAIINSEMSSLQVRGQIIELQMQLELETNTYLNQINENKSRLEALIEQWQQNYLLVSPIDGQLSFVKYWSSNQNVIASEKLATIVSKNRNKVIGRMHVPSHGFGKVKIGQTVNVKLDGYPYTEYGILKGKVDRISAVPDIDGYIVEISYPNGLISTYKKNLNLIHQMSGVGEIITRDERLIFKFFNPIRAFFDKVSN